MEKYLSDLQDLFQHGETMILLPEFHVYYKVIFILLLLSAETLKPGFSLWSVPLPDLWPKLGQ